MPPSLPVYAHLSVPSLSTGRSKDAANEASDEELSEIDQACDTLLPERVKMEYSGAPGDSWAPARGAGGKLSSSAPQRTVLSVKRQKRELSATTAKGRQEIARVEGVKQKKRGEVTEEEEMRMSKALSRILSRVIDRIAPPPEETTNWRGRAWEAEVGCARLAVSVRVYKAHKKFSAELEELVRERTEGGGVGGKAGGGGVRGETRSRGVGGGVEGGGSRSTGLREKYLENVLRELEARMLEDTEAQV